MTIPGFEADELTLEGVTRTVFTGVGDDVVVGGGDVILMHELPGMTPECLALARELMADGFRVHLPLLFGKAGRTATALNWVRCCISREFHLFATDQSSPVTSWLRALARRVRETSPEAGRGVGVIGMCLTGGFALAMMADDAVCAPIASQPALPMGRSSTRQGALGISPRDLAAAKRRAAAGTPLLGLRFTHDPYCPKARFDTLERELGPAFERIEIDSAPGNPHGLSTSAHSVLTVELRPEAGHPTREAYHRVVAFLRERLTGRTGT